jgi:hypothetical protein
MVIWQGLKIKKAPSRGLLVIQTIHKNKSSCCQATTKAIVCLEQLLLKPWTTNGIFAAVVTV